MKRINHATSFIEKNNFSNPSNLTQNQKLVLAIKSNVESTILRRQSEIQESDEYSVEHQLELLNRSLAASEIAIQLSTEAAQTEGDELKDPNITISQRSKPP